MPRIVKAYDDRYAQFLDVAQELFYQKGYDQTSVQEIIAAMGVAKGLFYYYFRTKGDLLDAVIERMAAQTLQTLSPMLTDPTLDAQSKFLQLLATYRAGNSPTRPLCWTSCACSTAMKTSCCAPS